MHSAEVEKLRVYIEDYESGMYATNEIIGAIIGLLTDASDFRVVWEEVPEWVRTPIWEFLKGCNETSVLYNFSSRSSAPISSQLLDLKSWLAPEKGYM